MKCWNHVPTIKARKVSNHTILILDCFSMTTSASGVFIDTIFISWGVTDCIACCMFALQSTEQLVHSYDCLPTYGSLDCEGHFQWHRLFCKWLWIKEREATVLWFFQSSSCWLASNSFHWIWGRWDTLTMFETVLKLESFFLDLVKANTQKFFAQLKNNIISFHVPYGYSRGTVVHNVLEKSYCKYQLSRVVTPLLVTWNWSEHNTWGESSRYPWRIRNHQALWAPKAVFQLQSFYKLTYCIATFSPQSYVVIMSLEKHDLIVMRCLHLPCHSRNEKLLGHGLHVFSDGQRRKSRHHQLPLVHNLSSVLCGRRFKQEDLFPTSLDKKAASRPCHWILGAIQIKRSFHNAADIEHPDFHGLAGRLG